MRFGKKISLPADVNVTKFAWLPIKAGLEVRWLEKVTVKYHVWRGASGNVWWDKLEFIDDKE